MTFMLAGLINGVLVFGAIAVMIATIRPALARIGEALAGAGSEARPAATVIPLRPRGEVRITAVREARQPMLRAAA